jgi:hypothetical protein
VHRAAKRLAWRPIQRLAEAQPKESIMLIKRCLPLLLLGCLAGPALAGEGLKLGAASEFWPGLQTDIKLNAAWVAASPFGLAGLASEGSRAPIGISLLSDYYFSKDPTPGQPRSGFRASSGLMMYQGGISLSQVAWASRSAATFGMTSRISLAAVPPQALNPSVGSFSALPYVGVGYSGIYPKSSWGFWADVGLVAQSPGNVLGFGRVATGGQSLDDLVRDLRLSPLVQLGVNYSF